MVASVIFFLAVSICALLLIAATWLQPLTPFSLLRDAFYPSSFAPLDSPPDPATSVVLRPVAFNRFRPSNSPLHYWQLPLHSIPCRDNISCALANLTSFTLPADVCANLSLPALPAPPPRLPHRPPRPRARLRLGVADAGLPRQRRPQPPAVLLARAHPRPPPRHRPPPPPSPPRAGAVPAPPERPRHSPQPALLRPRGVQSGAEPPRVLAPVARPLARPPVRAGQRLLRPPDGVVGVLPPVRLLRRALEQLGGHLLAGRWATTRTTA